MKYVAAGECVVVCVGKSYKLSLIKKLLKGPGKRFHIFFFFRLFDFVVFLLFSCVHLFAWGNFCYWVFLTGVGGLKKYFFCKENFCFVVHLFTLFIYF